MYNTRYHIASLLAVFLSLALGLVLGGLVVRQGTFDNQQAALVRGLRAEFQGLSDENRSLKQRDDLYSGFSATMNDAWAQSRLSGRAVVVVVNSGRVDGLASVNSAIESAGGQVVKVTLQQPGFDLADKSVRSALPSLADTPDEQLRGVAASLTAEWTAPLEQRPLTAALEGADAIAVEGLAPGMQVIGVVDLAVFKGVPDEGGLALVQAFAAAGKPGLAAQSNESKSKLASIAAERRISAVDDLGLEPGRYSVIALLTGAKGGYYGTGDGVEAPYPALPAK